MVSLTLKPTPLMKKPLAGLEVGGAQHDVTEFAGPDAILAVDGLGPSVAAVGPAGRVLGDRGSRRLGDRVGDGEDDLYLGTRIDGRNGVRGLLDVAAERAQARGDRVEVVGIGYADAKLDDPPPR